MDTLTKEVTQLPSHLQAKWAEESSKMIEAEIASQFSYLADFVEKGATLANKAFVKLAGSKSDGFRVASISLEKKTKDETGR